MAWEELYRDHLELIAESEKLGYESLEIVRRLLCGETVTLDGKVTRLRDLRAPPPLQQPHPPIWVGGIAAKPVERVAVIPHFRAH